MLFLRCCLVVNHAEHLRRIKLCYVMYVVYVVSSCVYVVFP